MGILNDVFSPISLRSATTARNGGGFPFFGNSVTKSGSKINENSALTLGAFYNGVNLCTDDIAKLPKAVFQKDGDNLNKLSDHPVHKLISEEPNPYQNPFNFWKYLCYCAIVKGNGYARIVRDKANGAVVSLMHLDSDQVTPLKGSDKMYYKYKGNVIDGDDMIHIYFFSTNGYSGTGIVTYAANSMGITLSGQTFVGDTFSNQGLTHGVLEAPMFVDPSNKKAIEESFNAKMSSEAAHKVALIDEGFSYKRITVTPAEAQWLETDTRGIIHICQFLNVAPHKLKHLDNSNYSNLQQMTIEHQQDSVMPRTVNIEQECRRKLFSDKEKMDHYIKFDLRSMLRGDQKSRAEYYKTMVSFKLMTPNEVRKLEELNPRKDGNELLQMVNMMTEEQMKKQSNEPV